MEIIRTGGGVGPAGPAGPAGPSGTSTVQGTYKNRPLGYVSVTEFGAVGDGVTDDLAAINAAVTACLPGETLYFPPVSGNGYAISGAVVIAKKINVIMDSPVYYTGTADVTALAYGILGAGNATLGVDLKLQAVRKTLSNWLSEANIGVKVINVYGSQIAIPRAEGFTLGTQFNGDGAGMSECTVMLGWLYNNKIGVNTLVTNNGYVTELLFLGGTWRKQSNTNPTLSMYGARIGDGATSSQSDHLVFLKPHFELGQSFQTGGAEAVPVLITQGSMCRFISCRNEDNNPIFARISGASHSNHFEPHANLTGGVPARIEDNSSDPTSILNTSSDSIYAQKQALVFHSGNLREKACYYDGATNVHIAGVHMGIRNANTILTNAGSVSLASSDYVEFNGAAGGSSTGLGIFIDTRLAKRFILSKDCDVTFGGAVMLIPYDSAGNQITGTTDPAIIKLHMYDNLGTAFTFQQGSLSFAGPSPAFGYQSPNGLYGKTNDLYFSVGPTVAKVRVVLYNPGNAANVMRIRSFSIYSCDIHLSSSAWAGYEQGEIGANIATTPPTAGTWAVGKRIYNAAPATGQPEGWVVTVGGLWKPFGTIA